MLSVFVAFLYLWINVKEAQGSNLKEHSLSQNATAWAIGLIDKEETEICIC